MLTVLGTYLLRGLHYEWVHDLAHITWCPRVSMGLGDRIFGTAPDEKETARSGTNRDLGLAH